MTVMICYIGLGSNLENPVVQLNEARLAINENPLFEEMAYSSLYVSKPMGPQDQPDYVNSVMAVATNLSPMSLLKTLQTIENEQGRVRQQRWGARTLDLDILLYGHLMIELAELTIPHIGISQREFVLYPLAEIAADLVIPNLGKVADLVAACPQNSMEKIAA